MTNLQVANDYGTMPTNSVAVESKPETSTTASSMSGIRLYTVPITADIQATLTGSVEIYATSVDEAASKLQTRMDAGTLDYHTPMEDDCCCFMMSYGDVTRIHGIACEIVDGDIEVDEDECHPADVLDAEVELLQTTIRWDFETQAKLKAFLEALAETQVSAA
jgi:hypothetical protein